MNDSPRSNASTIFGNPFANQVNNSPRRELGSLIQTIDGPFGAGSCAERSLRLLKRSLRRR
jgi:hypothetical protein